MMKQEPETNQPISTKTEPLVVQETSFSTQPEPFSQFTIKTEPVELENIVSVSHFLKEETPYSLQSDDIWAKSSNDERPSKSSD